MGYETKLDACAKIYIHQVNIMDGYLEAVLEPLMKTKNKKIITFAFESIIIRVISFVEEYLSCLVGLASIRKERSARQYFKRYRSANVNEQVVDSCNLGMLWKLAETQISFKENAKKIKRIFNHLFSFSPFPDVRTENFILDAVLIRNIIVHRGGLPNENYASQIRNPGVIIVPREIPLGKNSKSSKFYEIELIRNTFIRDFFKAVGKMGNHIQRNLRKDPQFSYVMN